MTVNFNSKPLEMFHGAQFANANSIVNLDGDNKLKSNGKLGSALWKSFRSGDTKDANNAIRTQLLKSLGQAFGLSGMTETGGKVTFSRAFMDELEKILGRDVLKTGDFKLNADGAVTSGRPLTQRRISAILLKAAIVGHGDFNVKDYALKLGAINKELAAMGTKTSENKDFAAYFQHIGTCVDFLANDFENLIKKNEYWEANDMLDVSNEGVPRFVIKDPDDPRTKQGSGVPLFTKGNLAKWLGEKSPIHGLFHTELYKNIPNNIDTPEALKALKDYVRSTIILYVQSAIDLYFDAKDAGKLEEYKKAISMETGACMDAKASRPGEIRKELGLFSEEEVNVGVFAEHDASTNLDKCLYEEIKVANNNIDGGAKGWDEIAGTVKKALVGQVRPIMTLDEKNGMIVPLTENGKQVVRAITEADIDRIGPACADILGIF